MSFLYEVTSAASKDPVTLEEAKLFLRVDNTVDDALITALISAATRQGEKYCNRVFVQRDLKLSVDTLQCGARGFFVEIARSPLISLSSFKYSSDGSLVDMSADDYVLQKTNGFSRVLVSNVPSGIDSDVAYPFELEFSSGYGAAADVPEDIKTAIKEHVNFMYENRGDVSAIDEENMPAISKMIYRTGYRIVATY